MNKPGYFATADGRIVHGDLVSLPVLAVNYEVGIAEYLGQAERLPDAALMAWAKGFKPLRYDHRAAPTTCIKSGHSVVASNGETYHEWIEVPVMAKEQVA